MKISLEDYVTRKQDDLYTSGIQSTSIFIEMLSSPSDDELSLLYEIASHFTNIKVDLFLNKDGSFLGTILPLDLSDIKRSLETQSRNSKDLGFGSSIDLPRVPFDIIECPRDEQHLRIAYIQRGLAIPKICPVCGRELIIKKVGG